MWDKLCPGRGREEASAEPERRGWLHASRPPQLLHPAMYVFQSVLTLVSLSFVHSFQDAQSYSLFGGR